MQTMFQLHQTQVHFCQTAEMTPVTVIKNTLHILQFCLLTAEFYHFTGYGKNVQLIRDKQGLFWVPTCGLHVRIIPWSFNDSAVQFQKLDCIQ